LPALTQCGDNCFRYCPALTSVSISGISYNVKCVDGYCFFGESSKRLKEFCIYKGYNFVSIAKGKIQRDDCFLAQKGEFYAHGYTVKKAISDLNFKILANKLKKEPINENTLLDVMHYRMLTGACDLGCRDFLTKNNMPFIVKNDDTIFCDKNHKPTKITAKELLPLLEKSNAYGLDRLKSLLNL
jgi:hypothetical protein